MEALIGRLSSRTGKPALNPVKTDLNALVSEVAGAVVQDGHKGKATVRTELGKIPRVRADREQIKRVVENLVLNACEALTDGGRVTVGTTVKEGKVIVTVSDTGRGMSQAFVKNSLFRPFTSTKKKGLGIGLYQCKTIVEAHGGSIEVVSEEGKGSTFRVRLPEGGTGQGTGDVNLS